MPFGQAFTSLVIGTPIAAGTPGSVLFVGATGLLAQDNANFRFDDANNQLLLGDGSAANPAYSYTGAATTGHYRNAATGAVVTSIGGIPISSVVSASAGLQLDATVPIGWASGGTPAAANEVELRRDAANTLALRRGANAQTFRVYNTFTDASNYERLNLQWTANEAFLQISAAGTGAGRPLTILTANSSLGFEVTNRQWNIQAAGHLFTGTALDNQLDIGASGANRPRSIFVGTSMQIEANQGLRLTNQVNGAGAGAGTLANAPAAGNPVIWTPIFVNGVLRHFPCW